MENVAYLADRVQNSGGLMELCRKLVRAADSIVVEAIHHEQDGGAKVSDDVLDRFGIDPNHDYAATDALADLLCEYPEVHSLDLDDGFLFELEPDACAIYRNLPELVQQAQDAIGSGAYVTWPEVERILHAELPEDGGMRDALFRALDARQEVEDFFFDARGVGIEAAAPQLTEGLKL